MGGTGRISQALGYIGPGPTYTRRTPPNPSEAIVTRHTIQNTPTGVLVLAGILLIPAKPAMGAQSFPDQGGDALGRGDFDLEHATALGEIVSAQDRRACELNQRGVRSRSRRGDELALPLPG